MLKQISMAAFALAAVSAMAQTSMNNTWSNDKMSWSRAEQIDQNMSISEKRSAVINRAREVLSGGDGYVFTGLLDRAPTSVDLAIVEGLFNSHHAAVMIREQMLMSKYPSYQSMYTTSSTDATGTTTTTTSNPTSMAMSDQPWRSMRMVMQSSSMPKQIDYLTAIAILTQDLDATQAGILSSWWNDEASIREKDVLVRILEKSAAYADRTYYPSVYMRRSWSSPNP